MSRRVLFALSLVAFNAAMAACVYVYLTGAVAADGKPRLPLDEMTGMISLAGLWTIGALVLLLAFVRTFEQEKQAREEA